MVMTGQAGGCSPASLLRLAVLPARGSLRLCGRRLCAARRLGWSAVLLLLVAVTSTLLSSVLDGRTESLADWAWVEHRDFTSSGPPTRVAVVADMPPTKAAVVADIRYPAQNFSPPLEIANLSRPTPLTRMETAPVNTTNNPNVTRAKAKPSKSLSTSKTRTIPQSIRHFAEVYAPVYPRRRASFFSVIRSITKQEWQLNETNALQFRRDVSAVVGEDGTTDNMYLTKQNIAPKSRLTYYISGKRKVLSGVLWRTLPKKSIFHQGKFNTCSVVGSSGILSNSNCGKVIDSADFVVRFNLAPVKGFETDVGSKTNFTTINPSFIQKNMDPYKNQTNAKRLSGTLEQFRDGLLFLPAFGHVQATRIMERTAKVAGSPGLMHPVYGSPKHFAAITKLWKVALKFNKWRRLSTGLYITSSLFDLCDRLSLFGFWPYATWADGKRNISYHYHDKVRGKRFHDFNREFQALLSLHQRGIVKIQLGPCPET